MNNVRAIVRSREKTRILPWSAIATTFVGSIEVFREIRPLDPGIPLVLAEGIRTMEFLTKRSPPGLPRERAGIMVPHAAREHS